MLIRAARADEAAALIELWRAAGSSPGTTDTVPHVRAAIEREGSSVLVAELDGRLVGSLIAGWDGWRGNLYRLAVVPEHRRSGIASALVHEGERRLQGAGARRLAAIVLLDEAPAAAFWEQAGYARQQGVTRLLKQL